LSLALFKAASFASQSKLYYIVLYTTRRVFSANLNDALHVAALCSDESSRDLKVLFVLDLNVKATGILHRVQIVLLVLSALNRCAILIRFEVRTWSELWRVVAREAENVLLLEKVRFYYFLSRVHAFLSLVDSILLHGTEITGLRRITLGLFTCLVKALRQFGRLRFFKAFIPRHPLHN